MTPNDEILAMAWDKRCREEYERGGFDREWYEFTADELIEFFRLAQAAAYERAAKVCDCYTLDDDGKNDDARRCASAIRALKEKL